MLFNDIFANLYVFIHLLCRFTGGKTRVLNLGSYNYLGFAQNEGPCADDSERATVRYGCGVTSTRHEIGTWVAKINEIF